MLPRMRLSAFIAVFAMAALAVSCSGVPDGIISPHDMASLLADIHQAEGVIETEMRQYSTDSMKTVLKESVYKRHGVDDEMVDSSMAWYGRHIEKYIEVYDEAIEILERRLSDANALSARQVDADGVTASVALDGDSVDVWTASRQRRFYDLASNDFIVWRVQRDRNWEEGDIYSLSFKLVNPRRPLSVLMTAEYNDGAMKMESHSFSGPGRHTLQLHVDPAQRASAISVVMGYDAEPGEVMYLDSISLVRERRGRFRPESRQPAVADTVASENKP